MELSRRLLLLSAPGLLAFRRVSFAKNKDAIDPSEFTARSRDSIEHGTKWLLKTLNRDGGCGEDIGTPTDISCTAMVGLALLAQGNTPIEGPLSEKLRGITAYLLKVVEKDRFAVNMYSQVRADLGGYSDHFFAALFLSQVFGEDWQIEPIKKSLTKLVATIGGAQTARGDWGQARYPLLGAICGWCALRGSHFAGINVEASADKTAKLLVSEMKKSQAQHHTSLIFTNAAGVRVLYSMGLEEDKTASKAFKQLLNLAKSHFSTFRQFGGEQFLAFHLTNEAMMKRGGPMWQDWFPPVRDKLIDVQNRDGSWTGYSCITSRTFCTATALLVLTSPNRFLPISQQ